MSRKQRTSAHVSKKAHGMLARLRASSPPSPMLTGKHTAAVRCRTPLRRRPIRIRNCCVRHVRRHHATAQPRTPAADNDGRRGRAHAGGVTRIAGGPRAVARKRCACRLRFVMQCRRHVPAYVVSLKRIPAFRRQSASSGRDLPVMEHSIRFAPPRAVDRGRAH